MLVEIEGYLECFQLKKCGNRLVVIISTYYLFYNFLRFHRRTCAVLFYPTRSNSQIMVIKLSENPFFKAIVFFHECTLI